MTLYNELCELSSKTKHLEQLVKDRVVDFIREKKMPLGNEYHVGLSLHGPGYGCVRVYGTHGSSLWTDNDKDLLYAFVATLGFSSVQYECPYEKSWVRVAGKEL